MRLFLHILPNSLRQWKTNEDWCTINNDSLVPNWTASANSSMVKIEGDALCPWKIIFILFRDPLLWWEKRYHRHNKTYSGFLLCFNF